jgi:hypothetical protein
VEVLDDDLLDVAVRGVEARDLEDRVDALLGRLADADQDPARERDPELARLARHADPDLGILVRRPVVRLSPPPQARRHVLEHEAHAGVPGPQRGELLARHDAGVAVWKHARFEGDSTGIDQVLRGRGVAPLREPGPVAAVGDLRLVSEAEERLLAAAPAPRLARRSDFVEQVGVRLLGLDALGEGAVGATIAAQVRERNEDVERDGDVPPVTPDAELAPRLEQRLEEPGRLALDLCRDRGRHLPVEGLCVHRLSNPLEKLRSPHAPSLGARNPD